MEADDQGTQHYSSLVNPRGNISEKQYSKQTHWKQFSRITTQDQNDMVITADHRMMKSSTQTVTTP